MPDIMMCSAARCSKSSTCYRHADSGTKAHPYYQSYWMRDGDSPIGDGCDRYWKATPMDRAAHDGSVP